MFKITNIFLVAILGLISILHGVQGLEDPDIVMKPKGLYTSNGTASISHNWDAIQKERAKYAINPLPQNHPSTKDPDTSGLRMPAGLEKFKTWRPAGADPLNNYAADNGVGVDSVGFYELTEGNREASGVHQWYSEWTMAVRNQPTYNQYGEQQLFWGHMIGDRNVKCTYQYEGPCRELPDIETLKRLWPGLENRGLRRRIYFISRVQSSLHDVTRLIVADTKSAAEEIKAIVPDLVKHFSRHSDKKADDLCKFFITLIQSTVDALLVGGSMFTGGIMTPFIESGKLSFLAPKFGPEIVNKLLPVAERKPFFMQVAWLDIVKATAITIAVEGADKGLSQAGESSAYGFSHRYLQSGVAQGMCQDLGAHYPDLDLQNRESTVKLITDITDEAERYNELMINTLFQGAYLDETGPSLLSMTMAYHTWEGPNSLKEALEAARDPWQDALTKAFVKVVIGQIASDDGSFITCGKLHSRCTIDEDQKHWKGNKHNGWSDGLSCPLPEGKPDADPDWQCSLGRLYYTSNDMWVEESPLLHGIEAFSRDNPKYRMDIKELVREAFLVNRRYGNNIRNLPPSPLGLANLTIPHDTFSMPVCEHWKANIRDFTDTSSTNAHNRQLFPSACGHQGEGTLDFWNRIKLGQTGNPKHKQILFEKYVPRYFEEWNAFETYAAISNLDMHWPKDNEPRELRPTANPRWPEIKKATDNMDPGEAEKFFCHEEIGRDARKHDHGKMAMHIIHYKADGYEIRCQNKFGKNV